MGAAWQGVRGGGWIHGQLDANGDLTGDDIAYIYPDLELALVGRFEKGVMVSGHEQIKGKKSSRQKRVGRSHLREVLAQI